MKITSEQEMLNFGEKIVDYITGRVTTFQGDPQTSGFGGKKGRQDPSSARIIELVGDVGAGKTTFTRGLAKGLGIKTPVTSPSFTISKSYACPGGRTLTHYDFYRLADPGIMIDDLAEKLADDNQIIIIEWGKSIQDLLPKNHTIITINYNDDNTREVTIK